MEDLNNKDKTKDGNKLPEYYDDPVDLFYKNTLKLLIHIFIN